MPYRYKIFVETGFVGGGYEKFIESDEPLTEDQVQDMAEQILWEDDEEIEFYVLEDELFEEEEDE